MRKTVRLTETQLINVIERIIKEGDTKKEFKESFGMDRDIPKNPLDLMARTLRKNDIEYSWPLNKNWLNLDGTKYRIYLNDDGTYRVQDSDAKHKYDKVYYESPRFGRKEDQTPERNSSDGAEEVVRWLGRWG